MPTIQELSQKYETPPTQEQQMEMLHPADREAIMRDAAKQGVIPVIQPSFKVPAPVAAPAPVANPQIDMAAMLQRLSSQPSPYADQMKEALAARTRATDAFNAAIDAAASQKEDSAPSQAELYFRLAAAFGAPTKTGSFFESLGNAGQVAADFRKETRTAESGSRAKQLQLMLEKQKLALQGADTDLSTLRTLASEESKDKRAIQTELFKQYMASGKPQSEAGKFAADQGFKPGTPEFATAAQKYFDAKLESGDWYKQVMAGVAAQGLTLQQQAAAAKAESAKKLTPAEVKLRTETEDTVAALDSSMASLRKAFKLNPNTYDASLADKAQYATLRAAGSSDKKVVDTAELYNLLGKQGLEQLKATFGAAPTEGERTVLMSLQGLDSKSIAERKVILENTYKALVDKRAREKKRLDDILAGSYRDTKPIDSE